jgi:outer membrane immunogenic protein
MLCYRANVKTTGVIMKVKGFLLIGAAGVAMAPGAQAADLAVKAPPLAMPAPSWSGWYIGVNAGAVLQTADQTYGVNGCCTLSVTGKNTGFIGGGQVGYNFQAGSFVYGIEGDFDGLSGKVNLKGTFNPAAQGYTGQISWLATIRGRVGVAVGDTMPYFTAGLAVAKVKNVLNTFNSTDSTYSDGSTRVGWTVGGGVEHMITRNWTVKFEGLWVDLGSKDINAATFTNSAKVSRFANHAVIARAGLNYRF